MKFCRFWNLSKSRDVMDFFYEAGYPYESQGYTDRRDYISWLGEELIEENGKYHFELAVESAWSPHLDMFFKYAIDKYKGEVKIKYFSEEGDCEVLESNDFGSQFFTTRYKVNYAHNDNSGTEYFDNIEELVAFIDEELGVKFTPELLANNLKVIERGLDIGLKRDDEDNYLVITQVDLTNHYAEGYYMGVPF